MGLLTFKQSIILLSEVLGCTSAHRKRPFEVIFEGEGDTGMPTDRGRGMDL
jgi:hypothetical protein